MLYCNTCGRGFKFPYLLKNHMINNKRPCQPLIISSQKDIIPYNNINNESNN